MHAAAIPARPKDIVGDLVEPVSWLRWTFASGPLGRGIREERVYLALNPRPWAARRGPGD